MPAVTGIAMGAMTAYNVVDALVRRRKAQKALDTLKKTAMPQFRSAQDIQREAESSVRSGFSPEEKAGFQQSLARRTQAAYRQATQTNPNLASAVSAGINYGNVGALTQFATEEGRARRAKTSEMAGRITQQSNYQTQQALQQRYQKEQAYGLAKQQASADIQGAIMGGIYGATQLAGQFGKKTPTDTTATTGGGGIATVKTEMGNAITTPLVSPYKGQAYQPYASSEPMFNANNIFNGGGTVPYRKPQTPSVGYQITD